MKKSRHSEEKVIAVVKQMEGGRKTADVARELGVSAATLSGRANRGACRSARPSACGNWRARIAA
jgi:transposase-like protein